MASRRGIPVDQPSRRLGRSAEEPRQQREHRVSGANPVCRVPRTGDRGREERADRELAESPASDRQDGDGDRDREPQRQAAVLDRRRERQHRERSGEPAAGERESGDDQGKTERHVRPRPAGDDRRRGKRGEEEGTAHSGRSGADAPRQSHERGQRQEKEAVVAELRADPGRVDSERGEIHGFGRGGKRGGTVERVDRPETAPERHFRKPEVIDEGVVGDGRSERHRERDQSQSRQQPGLPGRSLEPRNPERRLPPREQQGERRNQQDRENDLSRGESDRAERPNDRRIDAESERDLDQPAARGFFGGEPEQTADEPAQRVEAREEPRDEENPEELDGPVPQKDPFEREHAFSEV